MNKICCNLVAFNFTMKTIQSCETIEHVDGARNMVEAYGKLHSQNPKTAFRYQQLIGAVLTKKQSLT